MVAVLSGLCHLASTEETSTIVDTASPNNMVLEVNPVHGSLSTFDHLMDLQLPLLFVLIFVPGVLFSKHWRTAQWNVLSPQPKHNSHVSTTNEPSYHTKHTGFLWVEESCSAYRTKHPD